MTLPVPAGERFASRSASAGFRVEGSIHTLVLADRPPPGSHLTMRIPTSPLPGEVRTPDPTQPKFNHAPGETKTPRYTYSRETPLMSQE